MHAPVETKLSIGEIEDLVGFITGRKGGKSFDNKSMAIYHLNGAFKSRVGTRLYERYHHSLLHSPNANTARHLLKLVCDEADGKIPSTLEGYFKPQGDTEMIAPVQTPKTDAKPVPAATAVSRAGRKTSFAGLKLNALVATNERRAGSAGFNSLQIVLDNPGISVEDFIAKGGRGNDLKWDIEKGRILAA